MGTVVTDGAWRYENYGTADLLTISGTTVENANAKYHSAFYQTARNKCFDIPSTREIWVKFDVYSNNYNTRWRAYNDNDGDVYGVCSDSYNVVFWASNSVSTNSRVLSNLKLQTVLLHMVSGNTDGIIEAWLDGTLLYTYTGNVNKGADFDNFYLQSDGANTTFSNVIISNMQIGLDENVTFEADVEFNIDTKRRVKNQAMLPEGLKVWLKFNKDTTTDFCGNEWTAHNNPALTSTNAFYSKALRLEGGYTAYSNNGQYLSINEGFTLGGQDFTIDGWASFDSDCGTDARLFCLWNYSAVNTSKTFALMKNGTANEFVGIFDGVVTSAVNIPYDTLFHFAIVYEHNKTLLTFYINGTAFATIYREFPETTYNNFWIGRSNYRYNSVSYYKGTLDEFRVFDGVALWTDDFTLPEVEEYLDYLEYIDYQDYSVRDVSFDVSTLRKVARSINFNIDTNRDLPLILKLDTRRKLQHSINLDIDTSRKLKNNADFQIDTKRRNAIPANFNLDTLRDLRLVLRLDTSRKLKNNVTVSIDTNRVIAGAWRYENYGTADLLSVQGTTVENTNTKYHSAFYQPTRVKCFDIPSTKEIWAKFDVYTTNYVKWRAYNQADATSVADGITSDSNHLVFWSSEDSNSAIKTIRNELTANVLQTVLLHMVSGKTDGVIEVWLDGTKLEGYTGNVNDGASFDDFYLQSNGAATTFSNVIISNKQIGLNENATMPLDFNVDLKRRHAVPFSIFVDTKRRNAIPDNLLLSTYRQVAVGVVLSLDTFKEICRAIKFNCDLIRKVPHKLITTPTENSIPTDDSETGGIQSINITIAEQQLTDQLSFVTIIGIDIMEQVIGQYLDYKFNMRIESLQQSGVFTDKPLATANCCSDIDQLLYTQTSYELSKTTWNGGLYKETEYEVNESGNIRYKKARVTIQEYKASAGAHIAKIANILGKKLVTQFKDFTSTLETNPEGITYADLISELFGWTSRVPNLLINCYIRDDTIYVIQRGYEQNIVNLDDKKIERNVTVEKSIVRTTYGVTTETTDLEKFRNNGGTEPILGDPINDEEEDDDEDDEDDDEDDEDEPLELLIRAVSVQGRGRNSNSQYYNTGRVTGSSHMTTAEYDDDEDIVTTTTSYSYDDDGNVTSTRTETIHSENHDEDTRVNTTTHYTTQGKKTVSGETSTYYVRDEGTGQFVYDHTEYTSNYDNGQGQSRRVLVRSDGSVSSGVESVKWTGVSPSPYMRYGYNDWADNEKNNNSNWNGFYTYLNGQKYAVIGFTYTSNEEIVDTGTLEQVKLYDSSFPIAVPNDYANMYYYSNAVRELNRKIQEVVTLDVYDLPHVIDFNDRLIFRGNEYFLQSNTATKTPRIVNKQTLKLIRWY